MNARVLFAPTLLAVGVCLAIAGCGGGTAAPPPPPVIAGSDIASPGTSTVQVNQASGKSFGSAIFTVNPANPTPTVNG